MEFSVFKQLEINNQPVIKLQVGSITIWEREAPVPPIADEYFYIEKNNNIIPYDEPIRVFVNKDNKDNIEYSYDMVNWSNNYIEEEFSGLVTDTVQNLKNTYPDNLLPIRGTSALAKLKPVRVTVDGIDGFECKVTLSGTTYAYMAIVTPKPLSEYKSGNLTLRCYDENGSLVASPTISTSIISKYLTTVGATGVNLSTSSSSGTITATAINSISLKITATAIKTYIDAVNNKIYFRSNQNNVLIEFISINQYFNIGGNIQSIIDYNNLDNDIAVNGMFANLFKDCEFLVNAGKLKLNYTTLANNCYQYMFNGCTSLVNAPELPATTLTTACYSNMFNGCTSLKYIKVGATSWNTTFASNWTSNVSSTGTFVKPAATDIPIGTNGIPSGWTVENDDFKIKASLKPSTRYGNLDTSLGFVYATDHVLNPDGGTFFYREKYGNEPDKYLIYTYLDNTKYYLIYWYADFDKGNEFSRVRIGNNLIEKEYVLVFNHDLSECYYKDSDNLLPIYLTWTNGETMKDGTLAERDGIAVTKNINRTRITILQEVLSE